MNFTTFKNALAKPNVFSDAADVPTDLVEKTHFVAERVYDFLNESGFVRQMNSQNIVCAMENFQLDTVTDESMIGRITGVIESIAPTASNTTKHELASVIGRSIDATMGRTPTDAWRTYTGNAPKLKAGSGVQEIAVESILPQSVLGDVMTPGKIAQESFGVGMDQATPDLRTSITVGIMRFFQGITGKMFMRHVVNEPVIYINRDDVNIYKTDNTSPDVPMVDLNRDPEIVSVDLTRVVPLFANDVAGEVIEDGYIAMNREANLMTLSLDPLRPAFASANKTDVLADDVKVETVVIQLFDGTDREYIEIPIPSQKARLVRNNNGSSTSRIGNMTFEAYIKSTTVTRAGSPTALLAGIHADDVVVATITLNPTIDLRTCKSMVTGAITLAAKNATSATTAPNAATSTELATITARDLYSVKWDARFNEENLRKSNVGAEILVDTLSYTIPVGKNYFVDYAFTQTIDTDRSTAILVNLINYGIDYRSLRIINDKIGEIVDAWAGYVPTAGVVFNPGAGYACSNRIKPFAVSGTFDCSDFTNMKELEKIQDIYSAARIQFNAIAAKIDAKSYLSHQLASGVGTYRVVSDPEFLGNILGVGRMHDRLKPFSPTADNGVVNSIIMLDSGVTFEIVTVPFDSMKEKIMGIPLVENSPQSTLNFAINADMGSMVAHYHGDFNGLKHRLFTNVRELPIVTNPSGFVLDVANMPATLNLV